MSTHNMHEYGPLPSLQLNCTCEISTTQFRVVKLVSSAITSRWWFSVSVAATRTTYKAIHFFFANETTILSHHTVLTCGGPAFFVLALQLKPLLQSPKQEYNHCCLVFQVDFFSGSVFVNCRPSRPVLLNELSLSR